MTLLEKLKGRKTYLVAILIGVLAAVKYLGFIDEGTFQLLVTVLAGSGLATMRDAVTKAADVAQVKNPV